MDRKNIIKKIVKEAKNGIIVSNLGLTSRELFHLHDRGDNFYMLGSMGLASSIGLGIALNTKRQVVVLEGDGALLMNLGSLATIGRYAPKNLKLIIFDNECHATTGGQPTATKYGADIAKIAKACGIKRNIVVYKVAPPKQKPPRVSLLPEEIKKRFMKKIAGKR